MSFAGRFHAGPRRCHSRVESSYGCPGPSTSSANTGPFQTEEPLIQSIQGSRLAAVTIKIQAESSEDYRLMVACEMSLACGRLGGAGMSPTLWRGRRATVGRGPYPPTAAEVPSTLPAASSACTAT
jgi:hypothetical protein